MTPIAHLRALLAQGTKRPWAEYMGDIVQHTDSGKGYPLNYYPDSQDIATRCDCGNGGRIDAANVALIVAAVNALPELLDEIEKLRAENERIAAEYAGFILHHDRVVAQRNKDWDALMVEVALAVGTEEDREAAEMGEIDEFDPWHALRNFSRDRASLSRLAPVWAAAKEWRANRHKGPWHDDDASALIAAIDAALAEEGK